MSSTFSPSRSAGCSRMQLIGAGAMSRLRSSSIKKLLEPLCRAIADCLSSSVASSSHHGTTFSAVVNEASRTLWVLQKALEVWDLQVIPLDSPVAKPTQIDLEQENAFICHLQDRWFCIRKVNGEWYNFDSLYATPQ